MPQRVPRAIQAGLLGFLLLALLAAGCDGLGPTKAPARPTAGLARPSRTATRPPAASRLPATPTQPPLTATAHPSPYDWPAPPPTRVIRADPRFPPSTPVLSGHEAWRYIDNLPRLGPVHMVSTYIIQQGGETLYRARVEADLDARHNLHLTVALSDRDQAQQVELWVIDDVLYVAPRHHSNLLLLPLAYRGATLLAAHLFYGGGSLVRDEAALSEAGAEAVNGYDALRYELRFDLTNLGAQGEEMREKGVILHCYGYLWLERDTRALVRTRLEMTEQGVNDRLARVHRQEFDAYPGTVQEIRPSPDATPGPWATH